MAKEARRQARVAAEQKRADDEGVDRLVAGAYYFRQITHEQWTDYLFARAGMYAQPDAERPEARQRFFARLPFVRELLDRDPAID